MQRLVHEWYSGYLHGEVKEDNDDGTVVIAALANAGAAWAFDKYTEGALVVEEEEEEEEGKGKHTKVRKVGQPEGKDYHSALGSVVYEDGSGVHRWSMRYGNTGRGVCMIGIAAADMPLDVDWRDSSAMACIGYHSGGSIDSKSTRLATGPSYDKGDVITIELDMDEGTLRFRKNAVEVAVITEGISGGR